MQSHSVQTAEAPVSFMAVLAVQNDAFRKAMASVEVDGALIEGEFYITPAVRDLPREILGRLLREVRTFDSYTPDDDPYGEHDFTTVKIDVDGETQTFFFKIDYYSDSSKTYGSDDPVDPTKTFRTGTLMLASDY